MDFKKSEVTVDEEIFPIRELSARHRMVLFDLYNDDTNAVLVQAHVVQMGCPLFRGADIDQILDDTPGTTLDEISKGIMEISGLGADDVEEAEKN